MNIQLHHDLMWLLSSKPGDHIYQLKQAIDEGDIVRVAHGTASVFYWLPGSIAWTAYEHVTDKLLDEITAVVWGGQVVSRPGIKDKFDQILKRIKK